MDVKGATAYCPFVDLLLINNRLQLHIISKGSLDSCFIISFSMENVICLVVSERPFADVGQDFAGLTQAIRCMAR